MDRIDRMLASIGKSSLIAFRTMVNPDSLTMQRPDHGELCLTVQQFRRTASAEQRLGYRLRMV
jgi:hypothetical protein